MLIIFFSFLYSIVSILPDVLQSAKNGYLTPFHLCHYGSFAIRGVGLIIVEMTNVMPNGRITMGCSGIWSNDHIGPLKEIVQTVHGLGSKIGIQIAHAGRKVL